MAKAAGKRKGSRREIGPSGPNAPVTQADPPSQQRPGLNRPTLLVLIALGIAARLVIALISVGTVDAKTFYKFGTEVYYNGLLLTYRADNDANHPPIPLYWTAAAYRLTQSAMVRDYQQATAATPHRLEAQSPQKPLALANGRDVDENDPTAVAIWRDIRWFSFVFKLPVILADAGTAWLLWLIWRRRPEQPLGGGPDRALNAAAAFAWAPAAILVSGYHCNTDPIYAFFCLLCVYLIADRGWHFWGGVALAAAINVKIAPVLLIPPLLLTCRRWSDAARFVGGLSLGVIPFLPLLWVIGPRFYQNVIAYNSNVDKWGFSCFLLPFGDTLDRAKGFEGKPWYLFHIYARYLVFALVIAWAIAARLLHRWDRYEVAAVTLAISLVFTGGFGLQYVVIPLPLLMAIRPRFGFYYSAAAGLFLLAVYWVNWGGDFPVFSAFTSMFPMPAPIVGLIPWGMLAYFLGATVLRRGGVGFSRRMAYA